MLTGPTIACVLGIGAIGTAVVDETLRLVAESGIFPDDHDLLRRTAWIESGFGVLEDSYYSRDGIWQMDKAKFEETKNTVLHPTLLGKHRQIAERLFHIVWQDVRFEELQKPLYGALAVCLYLNTRGSHIPRTVFYQANFWYREYYDIKFDFLPSYFLHLLMNGLYPEPLQNTQST